MSLLKSILFANDFSESSREALPYALAFAKRNDATLHIGYVDVLQKNVFTTDVQPSGPVEKVRSHLKNYLHKESRSLPYDPESLRINYHVIRGGSASRTLSELSRDESIDLIVMGTRGRGAAGKLLLGSVASEIIRTASCNVLTVGESTSNHPGDVRRIMAPVDFSKASARGLQTAREWADLYDATLNVFFATYPHVHPDMYTPTLRTVNHVTEELKKNMAVRLEAFYEEVGGPDVEATFTVETGDVASAITAFISRHQADMAILATHGRSGFRRFALGSITEKIVRLANCPVLTVRPEGEEQPMHTEEEL